jgi:hypothetical protein
MSGRYLEVRGLQPGPVYGLKVVAVVANCEAEGGRPQLFPKIYMLKIFNILLLPQNILHKKCLKPFRLFFLQVCNYCVKLNFVEKVQMLNNFSFFNLIHTLSLHYKKLCAQCALSVHLKST